MSLTLTRKVLRDRLWALLEAEPEVTRRVRAKLKLDTVDGWLRNQSELNTPAAYPRITISDGRWTDSAFTEAATFAEENIDFLDADGVTWPLKVTAEYIIKLEVDQARPHEEDEFEEAVHVALLKGGPRLGNADVVTWTISVQRSTRDAIAQAGIPRLLSTMRLNASLLVDGRSFITTS